MVEYDVLELVDRSVEHCEAFHRFEDLRKNDDLCDITLSSSDGQQVRAHKVVLAARIPYFKAAFSSGMFRDDKFMFDSVLFTFNKSGIENVIQYAYLGKIISSKDLTDIFNTIKFADYFQLQPLKDQCQIALVKSFEYVYSMCTEEYLQKNIENCVDIYNFAHTYNCRKILNYCKRFISQNWMHVTRRSGWLNLQVHLLLKLLSKNKIYAYDENSILDAVLLWVEYESSRKSFLPSLLSNIHLSKLSSSNIDHLQRYSTIHQNPGCLGITLGTPPSDNVKYSPVIKVPDDDHDTKSKRARIAERRYYGNSMYLLGGIVSSKNSIEAEETFNMIAFSGVHNKWGKMLRKNGIGEDYYIDSITGAAVAVHDTTVFIVGGRYVGACRDEDDLRLFTCFDVSKCTEKVSSWYHTSPLLDCIIPNSAAACVENTVIVSGEAVCLYNIPTEVWTKGCSLQQSRTHHQMATLNDKVYCIGGYSRCFSLDNEVYDVHVNKWSTTCNTLERRTDFSLVATDSRLIAVGGKANCVFKTACSYPSSLNGRDIFTLEYCDPRMKGWMKYVDMPIRSSGFTASELQGEIYLMGGCINGNPVYEVYILDQRSNNWRLGPEAPVSHWSGHSLVIP